MTAQNFMAADLVATVKASAIFALFAWIPGYVIGWSLNLLEFRRRRLLTRVALSAPLSISAAPILAYLAGRLISPAAVWVLFGAFWAAGAAIFAYQLWRGRAGSSSTTGYRAAMVLIGAWVALGIASLIDLQFGDRLYFSIVAYDHSMRAAMTAAITRAGIPPHNPYFFAGGYFPLRYHYFWLILSSLVQQGGGVSARQAINAGTLWSGIGLLALAPLYLRFFDTQALTRLPRRAAVAIALFAVTGLDILPNLLLAGGGNTLPDMEWWNDQVTSWIGSILWTPHHVAGLVACLTGCLLLWQAPQARRWRDALAAAAVAGLAFATAVGTSVYVAFVFAVFLMAWTAIALAGAVRAAHWRKEVVLLALSGCLAILLARPFLNDLRGTEAGGGAAFLHLTVRSFLLPDAMLHSLGVGPWKIHLADLLLLPLNYFLELGFFFVVAILQWKNRGKAPYSRRDLAAFTLAGTSILVCTFLRSGVIANNDLGWRGFLPAQFILLLWSVGILEKWRLHSAKLKMTLAALLIFGVAGTAYEVCLLRFFPVLSDLVNLPRYDWLAMDRQLGKRTYAERQIYEFLRARTPAKAIVQHNPNSSPSDIPSGLYADRQLAAETSDCAAVFGGPLASCAGVYGPLKELFDKPLAVPPRDVNIICRELSIDFLVVKDTDKVWSNPQSWVWNRPAMAANGLARAFACGAAHPAGPL